jgi:hypothetical protein
MHRSSSGLHGRGRFDPGEDRFVPALLAGGDSRLELDGQGVNRYLCPPMPMKELTCLSSCTASPVSAGGFDAASAAFRRIAAASEQLQSKRIRELEAAIAAAIHAFLGLGPGDQVLLTASGTDGMLLAAGLLVLESRGRSMTVIMPSPSETGSGVPLAAAGRLFDGPEAGQPLFDAPISTRHVALRGRDGLAREPGAVTGDFGDAVRSCRDRPVIVLTHGSKTGLIAPVEAPRSADVIVDACQVRLPASTIRGCLKMGWPVVITGSKFLGGPPFSGAVLLPSERFSPDMRAEAAEVCSPARHATGTAERMVTMGPLLRWSAALATWPDVLPPEAQAASVVRRLQDEAAAAVAALPAARVLGSRAGCPGIVTFTVESAGHPGSWMTVDELRPLHRALAGQGVLVGQPVDLGPFGGLRVALALSDVMRGSIEAGLSRFANAWLTVHGRLAMRARAA